MVAANAETHQGEAASKIRTNDYEFSTQNREGNSRKQAHAERRVRFRNYGWNRYREQGGTPHDRAHGARIERQGGRSDILGNSPEIVRKHYGKWSSARQSRIDDLMQRVYIGTDYAVVDKPRVQ